MNPNLDAALRLHDKGFSIIPIRPHDKKPLIPWEPFMKARPTEDQIEEWFTRHPDANIAFITGAISGVDILDIDTQAGREKMDEILPEQMETPVVLTPRGGQHYYMEHTPGMRRMIKFVDGCDFLGDNGYALTPPSIGGSGRQYIYAPGMSVFDHDPMPIPEKLKQILLNNSSYNKGCNSSPELEELERVSRITLKFDDGTRDNDIFHAALMMLKGGMSHDNVLICLKILSNNCTPPFPEKEMMQKFESALNG